MIKEFVPIQHVGYERYYPSKDPFFLMNVWEGSSTQRHFDRMTIREAMAAGEFNFAARAIASSHGWAGREFVNPLAIALKESADPVALAVEFVEFVSSHSERDQSAAGLLFLARGSAE